MHTSHNLLIKVSNTVINALHLQGPQDLNILDVYQKFVGSHKESAHSVTAHCLVTYIWKKITHTLYRHLSCSALTSQNLPPPPHSPSLPPPLPCTPNPGQFLSPIWGTGSGGDCGVGQDVALIIAQSDPLSQLQTAYLLPRCPL